MFHLLNSHEKNIYERTAHDIEVILCYMSVETQVSQKVWTTLQTTKRTKVI